MNVAVSVFGRFHAFNLAQQLHKQGYLAQLITTYPKFEVKKYGLPLDKVQSLFLLEMLSRAWQHFPSRCKPDANLQYWFHERYDMAACDRLARDIDLFVGWSGFSERALLKAKERGIPAILERGSTHIEFQRDILNEEYERCGLPPQLPHPEIVRKEVREYELADVISVPSTFVKRTFLAKGFPESKLIQIPYGVDLDDFQTAPREHVFRVVFAGSLSLRKGVHFLLKAFAELNLPDAELWLLGPKSPEIDSFLKTYESWFRYFGPVPKSKLADYYSQCSVFVLCSIEEGMALVQAQAMACGLPLVCTTNTGGDDLISNGQEGYVIPIRDIDTLKEKINYLYHHRDECAQMGERAKQKVQRGLTWDDYGTKVVTAYELLLSRERN